MEKEMMIAKRKKFWIGLSGAVIASVLAYPFLGLLVKPRIDTIAIKESAFIEYPTEYNYRQSKNDCGPFNVAAVTRALFGKDADSGQFAKEIGWRLPNKYTLPWGLEKQLRTHGISIEKPNFKLLTDGEKITLIQQHLSFDRPIIILGRRDDYQHYMTLLGFDSNKDQYYIYDSLQSSSPEQKGLTTDENSTLPGNKTMKSQELLDYWRGGGAYGLWKWYGIVANLSK